MKNDHLSLPLLLISNYDQMLSDEDAGILFKALISYKLGREDVTHLNTITTLLYNQIILHLQADDAHAAAISSARAHAGRQGGLAKAAVNQTTPPVQETPPAVNPAAPARKVFTPPTSDELHNYMQQWCASKGYTYSSLEADKFMAFYESKNWMVGSNKMKDWQGAARGWILSCERDRQNAKGKPSKFGKEQVSTKTFTTF